MIKKLYVVIPCYNEEKILLTTSEKLNEKLKKLIEQGKISSKSKIMFVDDGSKDNTWEIIKKLAKENNLITGIKLAKNRGHQNALYAGLMTAKENADIVISMDADLQDDVNVIDDMINKYNLGYDIVYGVRNNRKKDNFFKRYTAQFFYKLMKFLGVEIIYNHADCRLMNKKSLEALSDFKEVNLFLRGIIPMIGFKTSISYYERNKRMMGESKYSIKKMLAFAIEGITSCTIKPLQFIFHIGLIIFIITILVSLYILLMLLCGKHFSTLTYILDSIWFIGSLQMMSIGLVGEYVGKTYFEVKNRPRYIIEEIIK